MTTFRDFDAAWEEQATDVPSFKALGETFTLPPKPPVKMILMVMREAEASGGDMTANLSPEKVLELASMLIGRDTVKTLLDRDITFEQLGDLIKFAQQVYAGQNEDDADSPPEAGTSEPSGPSSPTGGTSKPTSDASTDWIS